MSNVFSTRGHSDFAWEKLFPLTTGLSGDHAELEHMTVADAKG